MVAIPPTVYHVHEREEDGSLGTYMGGSDDLPSAVAIACSVFSTMQGYSPGGGLVILVVDDSGDPVAFIGKGPQPTSP